MYTANRFLLLFLSFSFFLSPLTAAPEDRGGRITSQLPVWGDTLKGRAEKVFGRPTMAAMLKNIAWFGGPFALMIYANKKIKNHHKARDIKLREQQGLAAQQQQMMAQLMMALQQGQGGGEMGGMPLPGGPMDYPDMREPLDDEEFDADEVRQPALPAGEDGEQEPKGLQAQTSESAEEMPAGVAEAPEAMMPMGMPGLSHMPQVKQSSYNTRHILSKKAYWFWQVTSWICASLALYNGAGLAFNSFALARSVLKNDKMPHKPGALSKVEAKADQNLSELAHKKLSSNPERALAQLATWAENNNLDDSSNANGENVADEEKNALVAGINAKVSNARQNAVTYFENAGLPRVENSIFGHTIFSRIKMFMQGITEPQAES